MFLLTELTSQVGRYLTDEELIRLYAHEAMSRTYYKPTISDELNTLHRGYDRRGRRLNLKADTSLVLRTNNLIFGWLNNGTIASLFHEDTDEAAYLHSDRRILKMNAASRELMNIGGPYVHSHNLQPDGTTRYISYGKHTRHGSSSSESSFGSEGSTIFSETSSPVGSPSRH